VTVDVQTVGDDKTPADEKVTIRDRDTMQQVRVPISNLQTVITELMAGKWQDIAGQESYKISAAKPVPTEAS
jgi:glycyl-tRNA synthetase (class II)